MMSDGVPRLRAVAPEESGANSGGIPFEVLRFATLPPDHRALLMQVSALLERIDFGTVVLVVHQGAVTQIEASEKLRLSHVDAGRNDQPRHR